MASNLSSQQLPSRLEDSFCTCFGGQNILICKKSWREYEKLSLPDRQQVWADLSGQTVQRRGQSACCATQSAATRAVSLLPSPSVSAIPRSPPSFENEPFPPAFMATLDTLPASAGKDFINSQLEDLREELYDIQELSGNSIENGALVAAMSQSPSYVTSEAFLLKFLRAELYDVAAAAKRITRHFFEKRLLFPAEALVRDIRYSDLSPDDLESLDSGYLQVLKKTDHIGRKVLFYYKALSGCYNHRENILRTFWYISNALAQDVDVQKRGVVHVVYNHAFPKHGMDYEKSLRLARLFRSVPIRFSTFWVCLVESTATNKITFNRGMHSNNEREEDAGLTDVKPWWTVVDTFSVMVDKFLSIRLRVLLGSRQECMYQLLEFGIPQESIPTDEKNRLKLVYHRRWLHQQRHAEETENRQRNEHLQTMTNPNSIDVKKPPNAITDPIVPDVAAPASY